MHFRGWKVDFSEHSKLISGLFPPNSKKESTLCSAIKNIRFHAIEWLKNEEFKWFHSTKNQDYAWLLWFHICERMRKHVYVSATSCVWVCLCECNCDFWWLFECGSAFLLLFSTNFSNFSIKTNMSVILAMIANKQTI